jgi:hypothetical protein
MIALRWVIHMCSIVDVHSSIATAVDAKLRTDLLTKHMTQLIESESESEIQFLVSQLKKNNVHINNQGNFKWT